MESEYEANEEDIKEWNESYGITAKGKKALDEAKWGPKDAEEYSGYSHYPRRGCGSYFD
jgi:hypothetical protein